MGETVCPLTIYVSVTQSLRFALSNLLSYRLSGLSPFMGDTDVETFANITRAEFDFDDDAFADISEGAKEFISSLLVKRKE